MPQVGGMSAGVVTPTTVCTHSNSLLKVLVNSLPEIKLHPPFSACRCGELSSLFFDLGMEPAPHKYTSTTTPTSHCNQHHQHNATTSTTTKEHGAGPRCHRKDRDRLHTQQVDAKGF